MSTLHLPNDVELTLRTSSQVTLCGQAGQLTVMGNTGACDSMWCVWQPNPGYASTHQPLLLACRVADLYHLGNIITFPEVLPDLQLKVVWLEVSCDDRLTVVLRPVVFNA